MIPDERKRLLMIMAALGALLALVSVGCKQTGVEDEETAVAPSPAPVIYLIPADKSAIEEVVQPERFQAEAAGEISATTEWDFVRQQAASGNLRAIMIHHAATSAVNQSELTRLFLREGVTVIGIGIPGLQLAELVGHPRIFTANWSGREGYTTPLFFYAYTYSATSSSTSQHATTESLLWEDAVPLLLHVIKTHIKL
jgi:hypothetical protein